MNYVHLQTFMQMDYWWGGFPAEEKQEYVNHNCFIFEDLLLLINSYHIANSQLLKWTEVRCWWNLNNTIYPRGTVGSTFIKVGSTYRSGRIVVIFRKIKVKGEYISTPVPAFTRLWQMSQSLNRLGLIIRLKKSNIINPKFFACEVF